MTDGNTYEEDSYEEQDVEEMGDGLTILEEEEEFDQDVVIGEEIPLVSKPLPFFVSKLEFPSAHSPSY